MKKLIQQSKTDKFDYDVLRDPVQAKRLKLAASDIKSSITRSIIAVGKDLLSVKELVEHGTFQKWISAEFGLSFRTAERYMAAASFLEENDTLSDLKPTALYLLTSPSTPQSVRDEVATQIRDDHKVTTKTIRNLIDEAKPSVLRKSLASEQRSRAKHSTASSMNDPHEVSRKPPIRMTRKVGKIVRGAKPPADNTYFWARIHRKEGRFVIDRLSTTSPRKKLCSEPLDFK